MKLEGVGVWRHVTLVSDANILSVLLMFDVWRNLGQCVVHLSCCSDVLMKGVMSSTGVNMLSTIKQENDSLVAHTRIHVHTHTHKHKHNLKHIHVFW